MACLQADLVWKPIHQPQDEEHRTADPPSHTESSAPGPLNEAGMFQFKGIRSIFKMWQFPPDEALHTALPQQPEESPASQGLRKHVEHSNHFRSCCTVQAQNLSRVHIRGLIKT